MNLNAKTIVPAAVKRLGMWGVLLGALGISIVISLGIGRFDVPIAHVAAILLARLRRQLWSLQ